MCFSDGSGNKKEKRNCCPPLIRRGNTRFGDFEREREKRKL